MEGRGVAHLDTVRALHQTVVSLRTALEVSKNELKVLKEKYQKHSECIDFTDIIEKLTLENHILRRRIIDSGGNESDGSKTAQNIQLQVTYSPRSQGRDSASEIVIKTETPDINSEFIEVRESVSATSEEEEEQPYCPTDDQLDGSFVGELHPEIESPLASSSPHNESPVDEPCSQVRISKHETNAAGESYKTKLELLSKFDVRIKVRTIKEGTVSSDTTTESDSSAEEQRKKSEKDKPKTVIEEQVQHIGKVEDSSNLRVESVTSERFKMAFPNEGESKGKGDKFDVQVKITSEENLVVKEGFDEKKGKDPLNLDVDDLSFRSMSEGDNSVFSETNSPELEARGGAGGAGEGEGPGSGTESEEVDDIELIFTTDESKDMSHLQEDLVSIREGEPWSPSHVSTTHSTPVLIKFHTLDPDAHPGAETTDNAENENQENTSLQGAIADSSLRMKRVSLPNDKEIRNIKQSGLGKSLDLPGRGILKTGYNKSDNTLYRRSPNTSNRRLDSVDSLTCEYNRNMSMDNTKSSSFELGSSMDMLQREESVDSFHRPSRLGYRYSMFPATDISKCGISEDDLSANLQVRRNTCPNPFQYRPLQPSTQRAGPLKARRRREAAAQTAVCALPPRCRSDEHLALQVLPLCRADRRVRPAAALPLRRTPRAAGTVTPTAHTIQATMPRRPPCVPCRRAAAPTNTSRCRYCDPYCSHNTGHYAAQTAVCALPPRCRSDEHLALQFPVRPERSPMPRLPQRMAVPPRPDPPRRQLLSDLGFTSMVPELSRSADPVWAAGQRCACADQAHAAAAAAAAAAAVAHNANDARYPAVPGPSRAPHRSPLVSGDRGNDWAPRNHIPSFRRESRLWRGSLPDVRSEDTDSLLEETDAYLRRSADNLRSCSEHDYMGNLGTPYIPAAPRQLRLGHAVKVITPLGRLAVGRVRYVGLAGPSSADLSIMIGLVFPLDVYPWLSRADPAPARRYFPSPPRHAALLLPFNKCVMAWAN
ncbi:uncharacterized protein LOC105394461 [Plutella xylostella]|uniref:uncharacterized protein LOC105394461 n=1 Tax=Plutella xylostella TaxID=51655 RepID=UPI00203234BE|nr:uncharacterized protein LOC105394461 [Plutella xylostella]